MASASEQAEFLRAEAGLRALIERQLLATITEIASTGADPRWVRDQVSAITRSMVAEFGFAAAYLAEDWYNEIRAGERIPGEFLATASTRDFTKQVDETVRRAVGDLFGEAPDVNKFAVAVASRAAQYAIDGARNTIVENSIRDPHASGWARVPHGKTCDFCLMLVGRGGVYKESTARFKAHPGCDCAAVPSWDLSAPEVPTIAYRASERLESLRERAKSGDRSAQRRLSNHRARIRDYIANNQDEFARLRRAYDLTPA